VPDVITIAENLNETWLIVY